jgi:hypothetical protein
MRDYASVAAILAGNTESTALNYARLLASSISIVPNNSTDVQTFTFANPTWTSLGNASSVAHNALIVAYRPTSGAADSSKIPLTKHDISFTPNGTNATATISTVVATAA